MEMDSIREAEKIEECDESPPKRPHYHSVIAGDPTTMASSSPARYHSASTATTPRRIATTPSSVRYGPVVHLTTTSSHQLIPTPPNRATLALTQEVEHSNQSALNSAREVQASRKIINVQDALIHSQQAQIQTMTTCAHVLPVILHANQQLLNVVERAQANQEVMGDVLNKVVDANHIPLESVDMARINAAQVQQLQQQLHRQKLVAALDKEQLQQLRNQKESTTSVPCEFLLTMQRV
jgi:hypothetical protein